MKKRALSLLLALVMCLGLLPAAVFAKEGDETSGTTVTEPEDNTPKTITVNFNSQGGSSVAPRTYTIGEKYGDLPIPTREDWVNYKFIGWYNNKRFDGPLVSPDDTVTSEYNTLYAKWGIASTVWVKFDSTGGSSVPQQEYYENEPYGFLPTPTREGYIFDGWSWWKSDDYHQRVKEDDVVSRTYTKLYAHWIAEAPPEFEIENGVLKKYNGSGGSVVIPDSVTSIGQGAFSPCSTLTGVVIPNGVTSIGAYAFSQCRNLRSVDIPSSVTAIEVGAFSMCDNLKQITIPDGVRTIRGSAFSSTGLTSVVIPDSVTSLGYEVFAWNKNLTEVVIGSGVTIIPEAAFAECSILKSVTIPTSVTKIEYRAFNRCPEIEIYYGGSQLQWKNVVRSPSSGATNVHYSDGTTDSGTVQPEPANVTVSFDSNGGSSVSSKTVTVGEPYGDLPTPTREGYTFRDWGLISTTSWITSSSIVTLKTDHTLTAFWDKVQAQTVEVTFEGGYFVSSRPVIVGGTYGDLPAPAREGYTFDGWYTSSAGGTRVTSSTTVTATSNHTLYARWIQADGKLTVSPSSMTFDKAQEGYTQPAAKTVTVKNTSDGEITLSRPTADDFELGALSRTTLAPDASATFTVRPKAGLKAGIYHDTITVKSTDGKTSAAVSVSFTVEEKAPELPASGFTDVADSNAYYYDPVLWAVEKGVTSGTSATAFSPNATCTRAQVVTFLYRAAGQGKTPAANPFTDVRASDYYSTPVLWAMESNITSGTSATAFSPNAACTRGQVVTFLWRAAGQPEPKTSSSQFADVQDTGAYYYKAVLWAVENGITSGTSGSTFSPDATCTRGQIVTFLYRAYK